MKLEELRKRLEDEKDEDKVIGLLEELHERELKKDEIVSTRLGVVVNQIRKRPDNKTDVTKAAEKILLKWKPLMTPTPSPVMSSASNGSSSKRTLENSTEGKESKKPSTELKYVSKEEYEEAIKDFLPGSETRNKCVEMLIRALMVDILPESATSLEDGSGKWVLPDELTCSTAHAIEACLYHEFGGETSTEYKAKFRSKYMNLQNRQSGRHLRFGLLDGAIVPTKFCSMSPSVHFQI